MEDSVLIRKFCDEGDGGAATELLGRYERALYQFIWQMLRHSQDCEDAMQETFSKALRALPRYQDRGQFKSWLFRIAHNEAIDVIRRRRRTVVPELSDDLIEARSLADPGGTASDAMEQGERLLAFDKAVSQLPEPEREVLSLRLQGELPFKEIAEITGAPLGTVLGRMRNAKKRLKILLKPVLEE